MKKIVSIILVLVLMLGCCSALAAETEARSANVSVTVKQYAITGTYDDLVLSDESGTVASYSLNAGTSATRSITGTAKLECGSKSKTVAISAVDAKTVYDFAKESAAADALCAEVTITFVPAEAGSVKNNDASFAATAPEVAKTLVIFADDSTFDDDDKKGNGGAATTGLLVVNLTGVPAEVWPGDKYTLTATANKTALDAKLNDKGTATITETTIYKVTGTGDKGTSVATSASATATFDEVADVAGTVYSYWAIAKATITE